MIDFNKHRSQGDLLASPAPSTPLDGTPAGVGPAAPPAPALQGSAEGPRGFRQLTLPETLPVNVIMSLTVAIQAADNKVRQVDLDSPREIRRAVDMAASLIRAARDVAPLQFVCRPDQADQFTGSLIAAFQSLVEACIIYETGRAAELQRQARDAGTAQP